VTIKRIKIDRKGVRIWEKEGGLSGHKESHIGPEKVRRNTTRRGDAACKRKKGEEALEGKEASEFRRERGNPFEEGNARMAENDQHLVLLEKGDDLRGRLRRPRSQ